MLPGGGADVDFARTDAQQAHKFQRVVVGPAGSAESRHRDTGNACTRKPKTVKGKCGHEQGERTVQPSGNAYHGAAASYVVEPGAKSRNLDVNDFAASEVIIFGRDVRYERMRLDVVHKPSLEPVNRQGTCIDPLVVRYHHFFATVGSVLQPS